MPRRNRQPHSNGQAAPRAVVGVRLQRVLADSGVASRRACEDMILAGRVEVNGRTVRGLPVFVEPGRDRIAVDGRPIKTGSGGEFGGAGRPLYIMLYKPARTVTTARDEFDRRTVLDMVDHPAVRDGGARLFPVGRLDFETTGLLLLTNDGDLAHRLTHASFGVTRTYLVEVRADAPANQGEVGAARLERDALRAGKKAARRGASEARRAGMSGPTAAALRGARVQIRILPPRATDFGSAKSVRHTRAAPTASEQPVGGTPSRTTGRKFLEVTLAEGRNRQVVPVLGRAGYSVRKVVCVGLGPLRLKGLAPGAWRELDRSEVKALRRACHRPAALGRSVPPETESRPRADAPTAPSGGRWHGTPEANP